MRVRCPCESGLGRSILLIAMIGFCAPSALSAPAGQDPYDDLGLIRALVRPYWDTDEIEWTQLLTRGLPQGWFDLRKRDQALADLSDFVATLRDRKQTRILIIENICGGDLNRTYTRHGVFSAPDSPVETARKLTAFDLTAVSPEQWPTIERPLSALLKIGGCNNGFRRIFHNHDATVISYFDGAEWRVDAWFFLAYVEERPPLRPSTAAYLDLLYPLAGVFKPEPTVGGLHARDLLQEFGDPKKLPPGYRRPEKEQ